MKLVEPGARAGTPGAVEEVNPTARGLVVETEEIAAHAAHVRLGHGEDGVDGHGGVRGRPTPLEDLHARERGERVRGSDHTLPSEGQGPMRVSDVRHASLP